VASLGATRAQELETALAEAGAPRIHPGAYLNEFAVAVPNARAVHRRLLDRGVLAGLALADAEPEDEALVNALLVCATEVTTTAEIQLFADALRAELADTHNRSGPSASTTRTAETAGAR
jgi:glycine dehydrogenase subunit 1